jgi:uncharacterized protein YkwD
MKSLLRLIALTLTAGLMFVGSATGQQRSESVEQEIMDAANQARRAQGLAILKWNAALASAAKQHAQLMARQNAISHQFPNEPGLAARASHAGLYFISIAENVAQGSDAATISDQWVRSPAHRQNLLDPDMNVIGIGVAERNGEFFATEDFAKIKR